MSVSAIQGSTTTQQIPPKGQAIQRFLGELAKVNQLLIKSGTQFQTRTRFDINSLMNNTESQQNLMFWQARVIVALSLLSGGATMYGATIPAGAANDITRTAWQAAGSFLDKMPQAVSPIFAAYQLTYETNRALLERVAISSSQDMIQQVNGMVQQFQQLELRILEAQRGR